MVIVKFIIFTFYKRPVVGENKLQKNFYIKKKGFRDQSETNHLVGEADEAGEEVRLP